MFYSYGTALQHNEITCKHTGALSVWCECTQNIFNQCFKQILTLSKDGLDKRDITILTSLQHALDVPLPVAGLS